MSRRDEIKSAYKNLGKAHSFYDGMMTGTSFFGRIILKNVWCMTKEDALEYQAAAFEAIPKDFSGSLLEVPVGTGVLSMPVWKTLPDAEITCLDYSEKMMQSAQERADEMQIKNHYPQLKSIKDCAFYYDDVKIFVCFHILEYCHHQDELEQQIS